MLRLWLAAESGIKAQFSRHSSACRNAATGPAETQHASLETPWLRRDLRSHRIDPGVIDLPALILG